MTAPPRRFRSLQAWRLAHHLSQREAAKQVGITQATWCRYEDGSRRPKRRRAEQLEAATGVRAADLMLNGPKALVWLALWAGGT